MGINNQNNNFQNSENNTAQNFNGATIGNITNKYLLHKEKEVVLKYNFDGKLINENELLVDLLSIDNFSFSFKVISEDIYSNFYEDKHWEKTCLDLKRYVLLSLKENTWNEKKIYQFINTIKINYGMHDFKFEEDYNNQRELNSIIFKFLLKEKLDNNELPNLNDKKLSFKFFYRENIDFNFIKVLGYEFNRDITINQLIKIANEKFNTNEFNCIVPMIENLNHNILELFLSGYNNGEKTYDNLKLWLKESNIESNLLRYDNEVEDLQDLFNLALGSYAFPGEDYELWMNLQLEYQYKLDIFDIKIPNDKTIETIKDARTNKNMTKVSLEDLKS